MEQIEEKLKAPFKLEDIEIRVGVANKEKTSGLPFCYIDGRAVADRLDKVIGPWNWQNAYQTGPDGGVICGIGIRGVSLDGHNSDWVWKWDGSDNTDMESIKGGLTASFKRAAVRWGIGRYLYAVKSPKWYPTEQRGKSVSFTNINQIKLDLAPMLIPITLPGEKLNEKQIAWFRSEVLKTGSNPVHLMEEILGDYMSYELLTDTAGKSLINLAKKLLEFGKQDVIAESEVVFAKDTCRIACETGVVYGA
jgi:hypothetical protein